MVRLTLIVAAIAAALAGGCGGGGKHAAAPEGCSGARSVRQHSLGRLARDLAALRATAARVPASARFKGNVAVNAATDRFLLHMETAPVDAIVKNRLIDHAMSALLGACEQCFQALEAARPIPEIAHRGRCGSD